MTCPKCCGETRISHTSREEDCVIRYRKCSECEHIFKTIEIDKDMWEKINGIEPEPERQKGRITAEEAREIREEYKRGSYLRGAAALSRKYGVDRKTINSILTGKARKWRFIS